MRDCARWGVVLRGDVEKEPMDEPRVPPLLSKPLSLLSDHALLPVVLEDDEAQRNGGSQANFPKGSCSETGPGVGVGVGAGGGGGGLLVLPAFHAT